MFYKKRDRETELISLPCPDLYHPAEQISVKKWYKHGMTCLLKKLEDCEFARVTELYGV
jgi:hypothetical protein